MATRLTTKQVAEQLKLSRSRIIAMIYSGTIRAKKLGRDWTILDTDVAQLQRNRAGQRMDKRARSERIERAIENLNTRDAQAITIHGSEIEPERDTTDDDHTLSEQYYSQE